MNNFKYLRKIRIKKDILKELFTRLTISKKDYYNYINYLQGFKNSEIREFINDIKGLDKEELASLYLYYICICG